MRAALTSLASPVRRVHLQLVPSHCGIDGNERADSVAKESAALSQERVPVDVRTAHRAVARAARQRAIASQPDALYRWRIKCRPPPLVIAGDRSSAVVHVHQLGASYWSGPQQCLHRMRRNSTEECRQSPISTALRAGASCALEETDTK